MGLSFGRRYPKAPSNMGMVYCVHLVDAAECADRPMIRMIKYHNVLVSDAIL